MAKIERVELIKRVPLERVTLEDGTRILLEPKKVEGVLKSIEYRKKLDRKRALELELKYEGPRGPGCVLGGWS